ncbi:MAG: FmdE family protein [Desulfobacteraceae bacterium]
MKQVKSFNNCMIIAGVVFVFTVLWNVCYAEDTGKSPSSPEIYTQWEAFGRYVSGISVEMIEKAGAQLEKENLIVLTNAGYAEVKGMATQAALDGISGTTGVTRGKNTLVEIHSAPWAPLWFAVYDKASGFCAYLETDGAKAAEQPGISGKISGDVFSVKSVERIDAAYLYKHSEAFEKKLAGRVFGNNTFRVVSIANAVAENAPAYVVRAFEFHDHFCPGVISGIFMAEYVKKHFSPENSNFFVHSVQPWCKEDALMVLLNATPGKRGYALSYPLEADLAQRVPEVRNAATIVYRQDRKTRIWEGKILAFEWADQPCLKVHKGLLGKLCADLWYLQHMQTPETFVKVLKTFTLPEGVAPKDWAAPGIDPLKKLGLLR